MQYLSRKDPVREYFFNTVGCVEVESNLFKP